MNERVGMHRDWLSRAMLLTVVGVTLALRWPGLAAGHTSDEMSNFSERESLDLVLRSESGINPPLLPLLFNLLFDDAATVAWGRRFSLVCSLLASLWIFKLGELAAGGRPLGGLVAGLFVATAPWAVFQATMFRSYAPWLMCMSWHLYAVLRWEAAPPDQARCWGLHLMSSAILLPWLHYVSIPILFCLGLAHRRRFAWYVPSACASLPLLFLIATLSKDRVPMGLGPEALQSSAGLAMLFETHGSGVLLLLLLIELARGVPPDRLRRTAYLGLFAVFASTVLVAAGHFVRPEASTWALPFLAPLLGGVAGMDRPRWIVVLSSTALIAFLIMQTKPRLERGPPGCRDEVQQAARSLGRYTGLLRGRSLWVSPSHQQWPLWTQAKGTHPDRAASAPPCKHEHAGCFTLAGMDVAPLDMTPGAALPDGIVLHFDGHPSNALTSRCRVVRDHVCSYIYDCGSVPASGSPAQ